MNAVAPSKKYRLAFRAAAGIVPIIMGIVGAYYGNVKPVIHDVCEVLLPAGVVTALPIEADAGAPR